MSGFDLTRRQALIGALGGAAIAALPFPAFAFADGFDEAAIDAVVAEFMAAFETPGVGIAIVRTGGDPFVRGYGVRTLGKSAKVDEHTRFGIASNSKAFTAAAIAMLVDEGKAGWEDRLIQHLPEFRMYDPAVTQSFTVRDLLVHRSGLPLGAGDLMFFPQSSHVPADALTALPYLKPVRGFRTGYDYDNILYIVAGLLIERLSGMSWTDFITARILKPLGMVDAVASRRLLASNNVAGRHARLGPPVRGMGPMQVIQPDEGSMIDAGAGVNASVSDIVAWLQVQLDQGVAPDGKRLWSAAQATEMWLPQTIVGAGNGPSPRWPASSVTQTYALGWFVQDYRGERLIHHSGGLSGQVTQTCLLPGRGVGIAVFSNTEDAVSGGIRNALIDRMIDAPAFDWVAASVSRTKAYQQQSIAELGSGTEAAPEGSPSLSLAAYVGRYRDPWYGDIVVAMKGKALAIDFVPTAAFKSVLTPWGPDAFRTRFVPGAGEDAVVTFAVADGKVSGVTMKALSPLADFSYDFHHLAFRPVEG